MSIQVVIFLLHNIILLLNNIQLWLQKLKINVIVWFKQKNMSSKFLTCSQVVSYCKENMSMKNSIQNERNEGE
jgi:hypothetical protein